MSRIEVMSLDGTVTEVAKAPSEYFAEWRLELEGARRRREAAGIVAFGGRRSAGASGGAAPRRARPAGTGAKGPTPTPAASRRRRAHEITGPLRRAG